MIEGLAALFELIGSLPEAIRRMLDWLDRRKQKRLAATQARQEIRPWE